jgi:Alphaherpesvirus glycoprotein E
MRHLTKCRSLSAAILVVGCLVAGCGSSIKSAISSLPSPSVTISPRPSVTISPSPSVTISPSPTVTATPTVRPSTPSVTTPASATPSSAPTAESGTSLIWLWVLLGVVVLVGLIVWIARSARRRSAAAAGWQSRLIDAYAKGSALHDAMSVAEAPGGLAAADAGARWSDIQRRADDLAQTLYELRETAPDPEDRARIADTLASLQAVRSAMDAERATGGAGAEQADVVRSRLSSFESSLRALRAPDRP